ncbi:MAG: 6-carboxytetrahydropterin synthase, partial [Singulisphaera sp.]|nr:6-carboxytetrahydropterin synthase [Singulisphaera sp.]
HNGKAVIVLEAPALDHRGMLVDFGDIKRTVQRWIDENLDHNLLLCREDPILPVLQQHGERIFVMDCNPTAENIARLIFEHTADAGLPVVEVIVWETETCHAAYTAS